MHDQHCKKNSRHDLISISQLIECRTGLWVNIAPQSLPSQILLLPVASSILGADDATLYARAVSRARRESVLAEKCQLKK